LAVWLAESSLEFTGDSSACKAGRTVSCNSTRGFSSVPTWTRAFFSPRPADRAPWLAEAPSICQITFLSEMQSRRSTPYVRIAPKPPVWPRGWSLCSPLHEPPSLLHRAYCESNLLHQALLACICTARDARLAKASSSALLIIARVHSVSLVE